MDAVFLKKFRSGRPQRRNSIVSDLTPLVDIAFLLLTFFMLSASWNTPQVIEMALPPDQAQPVEASRLMNLHLGSDGMISCSMAGQGQRIIAPDKLRQVVDEQLAARPTVIFAVEAAPDAEYGLLIDILDELYLAEAKVQTSDPSQSAQERIVLTRGGLSPR